MVTSDPDVDHWMENTEYKYNLIKKQFLDVSETVSKGLSSDDKRNIM